MNKLFGLAIAVVVVIALLTVFKEQAVEISKKLFSNFNNSIDSNLILVLPKLF
jgi:hypothetical protein